MDRPINLDSNKINNNHQFNHSTNLLTSPLSAGRKSSQSFESKNITRTSSASQSGLSRTSSASQSGLTRTASSSQSVSQSTSQFELAIFKRPLSSTDRAYVKELTTYSLSRLEKEPVKLLERDQAINQAIIDLSVSNYKTFINTGTVIHDSYDRLIDMEASLGLIADRIPDLSNKCDDFLTKSQSIRTNQSINQSMIDHQITLLELLELPSLMDACVRANMFEEAIDLFDYIHSIHQRHPNNMPILRILIDEMEAIKQTIQSINLTMLQSNIQLSQCLRVISHLRRLDQSTNQSTGQSDELTLRLKFLSCRDKYVQSLIDATGTKSINQTGHSPVQATTQSINESQQHYEYLTRLMDIHRVHMSDVVTQYRAIFVDETPEVSSTPSTQQSPDQSSMSDDRGLLHRWCHHRINQLINAINQRLPKINESSYLFNLIEQSIYCGSSLARVGCDFRPLIVRSFEQSIQSLFDRSIDQAPVAFANALTEFVLFVPLTDLNRLGMPIDQHNQFNQLIQFPPLISAANQFIQSINRIRHVALIALMHSINQSVQNALQQIANQLKTLKLTTTTSYPRPNTYSSSPTSQSTNQSTTQSDLEEHWRDPVAHLSYAFINQFVPYINSLIVGLYGDQVSTQATTQAARLESQLAPLYEQQLAEVRRSKQLRARSAQSPSTQSPHSLSRASSSASSPHTSNRSSTLNSPKAQPINPFGSPKASPLASPKSQSINQPVNQLGSPLTSPSSSRASPLLSPKSQSLDTNMPLSDDASTVSLTHQSNGDQPEVSVEANGETVKPSHEDGDVKES